MVKKRINGKYLEYLEWVYAFFYAAFLAIIIRTFFYEPFHIPSGSMKPTLVVGDHIFVSKLSYGYSKYSLPMSLPIIKDRIFSKKPKLGDVIVFKNPRPSDNGKNLDYIKRLIGLPGDKIQVMSGRLYINGKIVPRKFIGKYYIISLPKRDRYEERVFLSTRNKKIEIRDNKKLFINNNPKKEGEDYVITYKNISDCSIFKCVLEMKKYEETLPNGKKHFILESSDYAYLDDTQVYEVPKDNYFMMGDNRDMSEDSRVLSAVGYVPYKNLIGNANMIFYSHNSSTRFYEFWRYLKAIRIKNLFDKIN